MLVPRRVPRTTPREWFQHFASRDSIAGRWMAKLGRVFLIKTTRFEQHPKHTKREKHEVFDAAQMGQTSWLLWCATFVMSTSAKKMKDHPNDHIIHTLFCRWSLRYVEILKHTQMNTDLKGWAYLEWSRHSNSNWQSHVHQGLPYLTYLTILTPLFHKSQLLKTSCHICTHTKWCHISVSFHFVALSLITFYCTYMSISYL